MGAGIHNYDPRIDAELVANFNSYVTEIRWRAYHYWQTHEHFVNGYIVDTFKVPKELVELVASKGREEQYKQHLRHLFENPTVREIENGDALNAAVTDLSDPRLGRSAARAAKVPLPAKLVALARFESESERVIVMLDELRTAVKWPQIFPEERFAHAKRTFDELVARMHKEDQAGDISAKTLEEARGFVNTLRAKLDAQPLADPDNQEAAMTFLKASSALVGLLRKPDIRPALAGAGRAHGNNARQLAGVPARLQSPVRPGDHTQRTTRLHTALRDPRQDAPRDAGRGKARKCARPAKPCGSSGKILPQSEFGHAQERKNSGASTSRPESAMRHPVISH